MKKTFILLFAVCLLFFTACDPASHFYDYEELKSNVASVELINYNNDDAVELFENRDKVKPFVFSKMQVIDILPEEKTEDFLSDFSEIRFLLVWRHLDSPKGKSVKINYTDGSFDIICFEAQFSCQYDSVGNVKNFIGSGGGIPVEELVDRLFTR